MMHLLAFYTNDLAQNASNTALGAVTDQVIPIQNSRYQLPLDAKVYAAYGGIDSPTSLRINTPSMRRISLPYITPLSGTNLPANDPPIVIYPGTGPQIEATEEIALEASRAGAGAADAYAGLWLQFKKREAQPGPNITVRATATIAGSEGVWAAGNFTLDQTLPSGVYQVGGMEAYGTNLLFARLIFFGDSIYRPGVLAQGAIGEWNLPDFRFGKAGLFGEFTSWVQPQLEIFCVGACAAQTIFLDLVKIR